MNSNALQTTAYNTLKQIPHTKCHKKYSLQPAYYQQKTLCQTLFGMNCSVLLSKYGLLSTFYLPVPIFGVQISKVSVVISIWSTEILPGTCLGWLIHNFLAALGNYWQWNKSNREFMQHRLSPYADTSTISKVIFLIQNIVVGKNSIRIGLHEMTP